MQSFRFYLFSSDSRDFGSPVFLLAHCLAVFKSHLFVCVGAMSQMPQPPATLANAEPPAMGSLEWSPRRLEDDTIVLPGVVRVSKNTGIQIKVKGDATQQRDWGYEEIRRVARRGDLPSIPRDEMEIVREDRMPFIKGTTTHAIDVGMHYTFLACYGPNKESIPPGADKFKDRDFELVINMKELHFVQGDSRNDKACGIVFRIGASLTEESKAGINVLRGEMGVPSKAGEWPHVTLASLAPLWDRSLMAVSLLRQQWAPLWPIDGSFPQPQKQLERTCRRCQGERTEVSQKRQRLFCADEIR